MNLRHEAILSLNTRVRRLRYLYKAVDFVSDSSISPQLLVNQLVEYGLSKSLYDEIVKTSSEPFSGHFFENISQSYEWNVTKRGTRRNSNAERVAESYISFGISLGLLVQSDQRISPSQLSIPLRFISGGNWLPTELQIESRNRYILALLWRFDRDLTCPLLVKLLQSSQGITIAQIETEWDTWIKEWLDKLIQMSSKQNLGNPSELLRYSLTSSKARKNTRRYAEHIALIRFHWFIDLGIARGEPSKSPAKFIPVAKTYDHMKELLLELSPHFIAGDIARIHFAICKAVASQSKVVGPKIKFSKLIVEFLKAAQTRGMSNIRLNLLDIVWTNIISMTDCLPPNFSDFSENLDGLLKTEGVTVVKAPQREETYIPTRQ
jgi:hypothetical protein